MTKNDYYKIGYIMKPHGLKGQVTISLDPEAPEAFGDIKTLFVEVRGKLLPFFIDTISIRGTRAFLKLDDVNTPEEAEGISKSAIFLPKSVRPRSARGEFYDDEIIGFEVFDAAIGSLGEITEIVQAGPNKLLSVTYQDREVLIPVNGPFIKGVNKGRRKVTVDLPEGFLEI